MNTIYDKITGSLTIDINTEIYGMVTGSVLVKSGIVLDLYGTVCNNIHAENNSTVNVYGVVGDTIIDYGANIKIEGKAKVMDC